MAPWISRCGHSSLISWRRAHQSSSLDESALLITLPMAPNIAEPTQWNFDTRRTSARLPGDPKLMILDVLRGPSRENGVLFL